MACDFLSLLWFAYGLSSPKRMVFFLLFFPASFDFAIELKASGFKFIPNQDLGVELIIIFS